MSGEGQDGGVTELLVQWSHGDRGALERLVPLVYDQLRRMASLQMQRERVGHTLQPTAVVHEAYLRMVDTRKVEWRDRAHFFAIAARVMRQILVDHARRVGAAKRGRGSRGVSLDEDDLMTPRRADEIIALDDALKALADLDEGQSRLVVMRYFGGLTIQETAEVLGSSPATVKREWQVARAWLRRELREDALGVV